MGFWHQYLVLKRRRKVKYDEFIEHGSAAYDFTFCMLNPSFGARITLRQIVAIVHTQELYFCSSIKGLACEDCGCGPVIKQTNIPLYSVYNDIGFLAHPDPLELTLVPNLVAMDWEGVKRMWLKEHMRWDSC